MQVRDELRVLVEAEVARAVDNFKKLEGSIDQAVEKTDQLGDGLEEVDKAAKDAAGGIGGIGKAIGALAEVAALTAALSAVKDLGAFALQTADNFQTAKNQFGVLLGDMQAGAGLFNEIKAFNDVTPFDLDTLTQATNVLISAKVPLNDLQNQLAKFGDLSQGNSQRMTSYVNAFSQAAAKGKADMQVLNTYLHQGVPILDALAKNFNVTTAEIVKMSSEGRIGFSDFSKALDDLTAAGGQYFGGMELASKSLAAMQEGLNEAVNSLAASFGDMLLPVAIAVVGTLTDMANAINESPILKGVLAGALVALTGYLSAMAVKSIAAFAAQMSLNFAVGAMNPVVMAATVAAAGLAAAYVGIAARSQKAAREAENMAYQQRRLNDAMTETPNAAHQFYLAMQGLNLEGVLTNLQRMREKADEELRLYNNIQETTRENLISAGDRFKELRAGFIKDFYDATTGDKIQELRERIRIAETYKLHVEILPEDKAKLDEIIRDAGKEIEKLQGDINDKAQKWKDAWAEVYGQFKADQADDPFYAVELERKKKLQDAWDNYVRTGNQKTLDQVNEYYDAKRGEIIKHLADEEARIQRDLSSSKIDNLEYEYQKALDDINKLEKQRVIAAAGSAEEIARIQNDFEEIRIKLELDLEKDKLKARLDEARDAVKDWQQELSDSLTLALIELEIFSDQAAVILGDLSAQLIELSASAALSGFEEFGRALGEGAKDTEALTRALSAMAEQILRQLPMMFLQAGLQLIANGQWPLGLGFIAAAGSSAIISGYVDGKKQQASKHAQGGVFDEYGHAARMFAAGGAFTNQIVSSPTYFAHGGGLGLMGEAGPEAIMPLTRMPNGDLGVQTAGGGAGVVINIINNSGAEVRQEETETAGGGRQIDITIGEMINRHIMSGKADRAMGGRFGVRAQGV